jgi:hypothetical protein
MPGGQEEVPKLMLDEPARPLDPVDKAELIVSPDVPAAAEETVQVVKIKRKKKREGERKK